MAALESRVQLGDFSGGFQNSENLNGEGLPKSITKICSVLFSPEFRNEGQAFSFSYEKEKWQTQKSVSVC